LNKDKTIKDNKIKFTVKDVKYDQLFSDRASTKAQTSNRLQSENIDSKFDNRFNSTFYTLNSVYGDSKNPQ